MPNSNRCLLRSARRVRPHFSLTPPTKRRTTSITNSYYRLRAVALAIAQNLLIGKLEVSIPQNADSVTASEVMVVGVDGLAALTSSPTVLHALRQAYSDSVRYTFILAVASVVFCFLPALGMENVNIKHIAEERQRVKKQDEEESNVGIVSPTVLQAEVKET